MAVVVTETDYGTKKKTKKALARVTRVLTKTGRIKWGEWWKQVAEDARNIFVPIRFGSLKRSIRVEKLDTPISEYTAAGYVVIMEKEEVLNRMVVAGGEIDQLTGVMVDYAKAVHDGHVSTGGRWVPAQPFLRQAIDHNLPLLDRKDKEVLDVAEKAWTEDE